MIRRRRYLRSVAGLVTGGALAGCPGSDETIGQGDGAGDDGGTATRAAGETPTERAETTAAEAVATPESVAQREYPDYNWDILDDERPETTTTVVMGQFAYDPVIARVPAGTEIAFPNRDSAPHTVTIPAVDVDENVDGGGEATITVDEPGTYDYVCTYHAPDMLGRLVVEEGLTVDDGDGSDRDSGGGDDGGGDGTPTPLGGDY